MISIHALREEGDGSATNDSAITLAFLSTPSARRATTKLFYSYKTCKDFYPRPPRGGRRTNQLKKRQTIRISIHALREEGDGPAKHRQRQTV